MKYKVKIWKTEQTQSITLTTITASEPKILLIHEKAETYTLKYLADNTSALWNV